LPWFSVSEADFPPKASRRRRRRLPPPQSSHAPVEFPAREDRSAATDLSKEVAIPELSLTTLSESLLPAPVPSTSATPTTSQAPSEADSTQPTTPSSAIATAVVSRTKPSSGSRIGARQPGKILPIVPVVPNIPSLARSSKRQSISVASEATKATENIPGSERSMSATIDAGSESVENGSVKSDRTSKASSPEVRAVPKSWADLVRNNAPRTASNGHANGSAATQNTAFGSSRAASLCEVLTSFSCTANEVNSKLAFLKPRGLVNTGNMCYMNAVSTQAAMRKTMLINMVGATSPLVLCSFLQISESGWETSSA